MDSVTVIIPSLPERNESLVALLGDLVCQTVLPDRVLIGVDHDRRGPARVRNMLSAATDSVWLAFIDDDDRVDPHHLETLLAASRGADVVYPLSRSDGWNPDHLCPDDPLFLRTFNPVAVTALVRRSRFLGFDPEVTHEDHDLWLRMHADGARFRCVHETTWTYQRLADGRSMTNARGRA